MGIVIEVREKLKYMKNKEEGTDSPRHRRKKMPVRQDNAGAS